MTQSCHYPSWKAEVQTTECKDTDWSTNNCRFKTRGEAEAYVRDLMWRWTIVTRTRVTISDDPVNAAWSEDGTLKHLNLGD